MIKTGITGNIGSGKTTVSRIFEVLGTPVFYADDAAKYLMQKDASLITAIKTLLGEDAYKDGQLNRSFISAQVFNNPAKLAALNGLVHPAVFRYGMEWFQSQNHLPYALKEAALIFETGGENWLDKVILVTAPEEVRIARVMKRDGISRDKVVERINNQWPQEEKEKKADFIIQNYDAHSLIKQVLAVHTQLLELNQNLSAKR